MGTNTGVPGTCNIADVKTTLANYNAAVAVRKTRLTELNAAQAAYAEALDGQNTTTEELFDVRYNYTVSGSFHDVYLYSGITKNAAGLYVVKNADTVVSTSVSLPAGYTLGTERTDEHPKLAAEGYRVFTAIHTVAATHTAGQLATALAAMNNAQANYSNAVADEATKLGLYNTEVNDCAITTVPANAYLKDADPEDIEVLTLNDYTFVLNKGKTVQMDADTTAALPHQAFVVLSIVGTGHYQIKLDGTLRGTHNAGTGGDVDSILSDLVGDIDGQTFGGKTYTAVRVGAGIYISCTAAFAIEVTGGPSQDAMYAFQDTVATVSVLPNQAKDGYVVKVVNSADIEVDDMWLKFNTSSGATYGVGTWEETVGPGITYKFDPLTMPHQLVRQADGSFTYGPVTWDERLIGDLTTNPDPSFVGTNIHHMFLYRNRFGFLSNETVTMSRAGDLFNFFNTTALTATDDDPIDISASTAKPVTLYYVRPTAVGLILFGDTEQFLLSTDSDILSPKTAKINTMSSYECEPNIEAVSTGISTNFIAKTALYTKVFNLAEIRNDTPPLAEELTYNIPELIPSTIDHFISSAAASIISLGTVGSSTIYQYRFLQLTDNRVQSWYKWTLTGTLLDQFFDQSTYYTVVANGSNVDVQAFNLRQSSDEGFLTLPTGERTDVFLDYWNINPYRTYDSNADTTRVFLPYDEVSGKTLVVVALGDYIGSSGAISSQSVGAILEPTVGGSAGAYYADIDGDYRGRDLIIGFQYQMLLELPKLYITKKEGSYVSSDQTADLVLHRINVATSLSGPVTYEVDLTGIPTWENVVSTTLPNTYVLNNVNLSADSVHVVPIYQRNKNTSIRILGDTPFPVTLLDLTWEGKYSSRFYRGS
jgi:outer membrane lipoprotein SlyB